MRAERLLLIGGGGYIGRPLGQLLAKRFSVLAPTRTDLELGRPDSYGYLDGRNFDTVVILASTIAGLDPAKPAPEGLMQNNVSALDEFLRLPALRTRNVLYFSSMAVYGDREGAALETDDLRPYNPYGESKARAEAVVRQQSERGAFKSVVLRIPGVYGGDRASGLLYHVREKARAQAPISVRTDGLLNWETIQLHDLCRTVEEFLESYDWARAFEVFNVGHGHPTDLIETVQRIVALLGSRSAVTVESKCYRPFYQDTRKIAPYLRTRLDFEASLRRYLGVA